MAVWGCGFLGGGWWGGGGGGSASGGLGRELGALDSAALADDLGEVVGELGTAHRDLARLMRGAPLASANLSDWTDAGVSGTTGAGMVPTWNQTTQKWTPGTVSTSALADPGANGIVKRTALNTTAIAASSDVVGLFGGVSCSGYLKSDGTCATPTCASMVVAQVAPTIHTGTTGIGLTTLYTPSAAGQFRLCADQDVVVAATAGTENLYYQFVSDGHTFSSQSIYGTGIAITTQWSKVNACVTFYADASQPIKWAMSAGSLTGTPQLRYELSLEQLQ